MGAEVVGAAVAGAVLGIGGTVGAAELVGAVRGASVGRRGTGVPASVNDSPATAGGLPAGTANGSPAVSKRPSAGPGNAAPMTPPGDGRSSAADSSVTSAARALLSVYSRALQPRTASAGAVPSPLVKQVSWPAACRQWAQLSRWVRRSGSISVPARR
ncbi:hypothetical protein GCM10027073_14760 [Streptomyces chlorus]